MRTLLGMFLVAALLATTWQTKAEPQLQGTVLGIFHPLSLESSKAIGARAFRRGVHVPKFTDPSVTQELSDYKDAGFLIIVSLNGWTVKHGKLPPVNSPQWNRLIDQMSAFIRINGKWIDILALANEPVVDISLDDLKPQGDGTVPEIKFFRELAARSQKVIHSDPALAHIRVSSPAILNLENVETQANKQMIGPRRRQKQKAENNHPNQRLFDWAASDPNIDIIDIHEHVATVSQIENALTYVHQHTDKPVIITEWSQSRIVWPKVSGWLDHPIDSTFAARWHVNGNQTNTDFIQTCYRHPVSKEEWDALVATANYDPEFMKQAFAVMQRYGVLAATYGGGVQSGDPRFDTDLLWATRTVVPGQDGKPQENYLFLTWYRELTRSLH